MARTPITTSFTPRTKPTSSFETNRSKIDYLIQESLWKLLLESWDWALLLESAINTNFDTTRYAPYMQTSDLEFVTDELWVILEWVDVNKLNILQTNWN